ncbi:MAG: hypothetical protein WBE76_03580 [Terracidiphilus sp.]
MKQSKSSNGVHKETLAFLKSEGLLTGTTLARGVERKVRHGLLIRWELLGVVAIIVALIFTLGIVFCRLI